MESIDTAGNTPSAEAADIDRFLAVLRRHCLSLAADDELDLDASLPSLGIDSVETVSLMVTLEEEFDLIFPPELLTPETFATPRSLWEGLRAHLTD